MGNHEIPNIVYHYCSIPTFMEIIKNSTLRMTNIVKSNDFSEITFCIDEFTSAFHQAFIQLKRIHTDPAFFEFAANVDIDKIVQSSIGNVSLTYYVTCFSMACDLLSQWRGYADDGQGVSIGFYSWPFLPFKHLSSWEFGLTYYNMANKKIDLKDEIIEKLCWPIKQDGKCPKISDYENITASIIDAMIHEAVFFKNPAFSEEQEVRLVYYPFGQIRNLLVRYKLKDMATNHLYYDRMDDALIIPNNVNKFVREPVSFLKRGNSIVSYIDINFKSIKDRIIAEIILGPKTSLNDLDFRLFLISNGYDISKINISQSKASYR